MKLSQRLQTILNMVNDKYDHVWDTCCDHGLLGRAIYLQKPSSTVHFVDVMDHLIKNIHKELKQDPRFSDDSRWFTHTLDSGQIPLQTAQSHLVIIAGVGGDLLLKLVQDILLKHHKNTKIDFILCPVRQLHKVRFGLSELSLRLMDETLIKEFAHYYEILHVSNHKKGEDISLVGQSMWNLNRRVDQEYLRKNLKHYGNMCKQVNKEGAETLNEGTKKLSAKHILDLYKALEIKQ